MKKARMIVNIAMTVVLLCLKLYTFLPRNSGTSIARSVHMVWNDLGGTGRAFIYEEVHDLIL